MQPLTPGGLSVPDPLCLRLQALVEEQKSIWQRPSRRVTKPDVPAAGGGKVRNAFSSLGIAEASIPAPPQQEGFKRHTGLLPPLILSYFQKPPAPPILIKAALILREQTSHLASYLCPRNPRKSKQRLPQSSSPFQPPPSTEEGTRSRDTSVSPKATQQRGDKAELEPRAPWRGDSNPALK